MLASDNRQLRDHNPLPKERRPSSLGNEVTYRVVTHSQQVAVSVSHACRALPMCRAGYTRTRMQCRAQKFCMNGRTSSQHSPPAARAMAVGRVMHALLEQGLRIARLRCVRSCVKRACARGANASSSSRNGGREVDQRHGKTAYRSDAKWSGFRTYIA